MRYEWDPAKAAANLEAHGVSFAEASTVFSDDFALTREDLLASGEQRFVTRKVAAEPYRDIDFSRAKQGPLVKAEPGKTKISIRLDNSVIEAFRSLADQAGGGNYQSLINDALVAYLHQRSMLEAVRQVVREELREGSSTPRRARHQAVRSEARNLSATARKAAIHQTYEAETDDE